MDNEKCDPSEMDNRIVNASEMGDKWFNTIRSAVRFIKAHITPKLGPKDTDFELLLCYFPNFSFILL